MTTKTGTKKNIWLVDFDDSFTYNICSELYEMGLEVEVLHWSDWAHIFKQVKLNDRRKTLILGPGPGHPNEYHLHGLNELHELEHLFVCGICLGHQLIWQAMGLEVKRCLKPIHGQQVEIQVPNWFSFVPTHLHGKKIRVQRYNSLCVDADRKKLPANTLCLIVEDELMATYYKNTLTYQFHPESVGTSFRQSFFRPIAEFFV